MQQTLFFIPHWLFEGPLLVAWLVIGLIVLVAMYLKHGNSNDFWSFVPVYLVVSAVIYFVLPQLEVPGINPDNPTGEMIKSGLAIRGYGLFLLSAILAGGTLAVLRCRAIGVTADQIMQLGFWMMVCGIAGARLFYVIQYPSDFFSDGLSFGTLLKVVNMTKGGMVVYGSLIGGMIAGVIFLWSNKLPILKTADLIAPGMALGLAIGRIGCLMNGCCFGGVCEPPYPAVTFPAGSPPYLRQLSEGDLVGIQARVASDPQSVFPLTVEQVDPDGLAAKLGVQKDDRVAVRIPVTQDFLRFQKQYPDNAEVGAMQVFIDSERQGLMPVSLRQLPERSSPTHPTQIYSAINAFLLCLVLWFFWTVHRHDGEVFALMLILYAVGRFLMEIVRQDEQGQFGTDLTISQWVSIGMLVLGFSLMAYAKLAAPRKELASL